MTVGPITVSCALPVVAVITRAGRCGLTCCSGFSAGWDLRFSVRGDLLDARLIGYPAEELRTLLIEIGRLLGMTKLLDMVLREEEIEQRVEQFFHGAGRFDGPSTSCH